VRLSIVLYCEKLLEIWFTGDYFRFSCILMLAGSNEIFQTLKILSPTKKPNPHAFGSNGYARFAFQPVGFRVNLLPLRCLALFFAFFSILCDQVHFGPRGLERFCCYVEKHVGFTHGVAFWSGFFRVGNHTR
jgi:hypothetical protein